MSFTSPLLRIDIFKEQECLGTLNYLKVIPVAHQNIFNVSCFNNNVDFQLIEDGVELLFDINMYDKNRAQLKLISLCIIPFSILSNSDTAFLMQAHVISKWSIAVYNQLQLDLLKAMEKNCLDWYQLSLVEKEVALRLFYNYQGGVPTKLVQQKVYLDANRINDYLDLYYELAKGFLGVHGSMTGSLDGLEDFLIDWAKADLLINTYVYYTNRQRLIAVVGLDYLNVFFGLLSNAGIIVTAIDCL